MSEVDDSLIQALKQAKLPELGDKFEVIQTHLSWVILTGKYAYKIKKPLNLGFQDFTTLEKRKHFCELELQLNQRLAPDIYLEVLPIYGKKTQPSFKPNGDIIEYAIKMLEFPQQDLLAEVAKQGGLNKNIIYSLAHDAANFHHQAENADKQKFGSLDAIFDPVADNFSTLKHLKAGQPHLQQLTEIEAATNKQFAQLKPIFTKRTELNYIKAIHGDMHLGNIVLFNGKPTIFDCIEFNDYFRFQDVINDMAFLAMDLDHKSFPDLANLFCNKYFENTGDYLGAIVLNFYKAYRAMVRAKVSGFIYEQTASDPVMGPAMQKDLADYLNLAQQYIQPQPVSLTITHGVSGSGKSLYSEQLAMETGAIRIRSDVYRKQMLGVSTEKSLTDADKQKIYHPNATKKVYQDIVNISEKLITHGVSVIVDATFIKSWQRELFIKLADDKNIKLKILSFATPEEILKQRLTLRQQAKVDASDADEQVLLEQLKNIEPLTDKELQLENKIDYKSIDNLIAG